MSGNDVAGVSTGENAVVGGLEKSQQEKVENPLSLKIYTLKKDKDKAQF